MSHQIRLHLFGSLRLMIGDVPQTAFRSNKTRALLAYLVLEGHQPLLRTDLVDLLWHGYTQRTARASLRMAFTNLRQMLGDSALLEITTHTVAMRLDQANLWCDALIFEGLTTESATNSDLREALKQLYSGEFLAGMETIDSAPFVTWLLARRNVYHQRVKTLLNEGASRQVRRHNLPRSLTPFIGRGDEIVLLRAKVQDPDYPLITITGEGGVGKTRLALALAHSIHYLEATPWADAIAGQRPRRFPDGIWYISLANLSTNSELREQLGALLCAKLGVLSTGPGSMLEKFLAYLQNKELWLLFDEMDHLQGMTELVLELLRISLGLHILVITRRRLNLQAEFLLRLDGLPVPDQSQPKAWSGTQILDSPSVQLFYERARRVHPQIELTSANRDAIVRICHLLQGLPLGIELAAALVEKHTCTEIADALQENFDLLNTTAQDIPLRQRSLRAIMAYSWQFLAPEQMSILQRCSVFHGGFTLAAAVEIANASAEQLQQLSDQSLLQQTEVGRFDMHELVRQFAQEQLQQQPEQENRTRQIHAAYFAKFLGTQQSNFQLDALAQQEVQTELGNVLLALRWGIEQKDYSFLSSLIRPLARFYVLSGRIQEAAGRGRAIIDQLRANWVKTPQQSEAGQRLMALLLIEQADFAVNLALHAEAEADTREAIQLAQAAQAVDLEARAHVRLGDIAWARGDYAQHRLAHQKALLLARQSTQRYLQAHCLMNLGINYDVSEEYFSALDYYQSALLIAEQIGDLHEENALRNNIGVSHALLGNYMQALHSYEESERLSRRLGDVEGDGFTQLNFAILYDLLGDQTRAQQHGERALRIFRTIQQRRLEARTLANLARIYRHQGDKKRSNITVQRALRIGRENGFQAAQAEALIVLADLLTEQRRFDEATSAYWEAHQLWQKLGLKHRALLAQSGLIEIALLQGDFTSNKALVEQVVQNILDPAYQPTFPRTLLLACYQLLKYHLDPRANQVLRRAVEMLQSQLSALQDSTLRQSFLENVPGNRTLLALATTELMTPAEGTKQTTI